MAERERPYSQFNFLVDWGDGKEEEPLGGFQEVSGLGIEITAAEYRNGNEAQNTPRKVTGMVKYPDVTMKRGVMGVQDMYTWTDLVRTGDQNQLRTVNVYLRDEAGNNVMKWELTNARPIKWTGAGLNATGSEVAVEEFVLAVENIVQISL